MSKPVKTKGWCPESNVQNWDSGHQGILTVTAQDGNALAYWLIACFTRWYGPLSAMTPYRPI